MAQKKAKAVAFTTPKGIAVYPYLNTPDYQFDRNGQFKCNLRVSNDDAKQLIDALNDVAKQEFGAAEAKNAKLPIKRDEDTGEVIFVTKSKFKPKFFSGEGEIISEASVPSIYGGSTVKLAGTMFPWNAGGNKGVALQLSGVQIIDLTDGSAAGIRFDRVEGGYVPSNDNDVVAEGEHNF